MAKILLVVLSVVLLSCETGGYMQKPGDYQPDIVAIGIVCAAERGDARPYRAVVWAGQTVEWFSLDGRLDIQFQRTPAALKDPQCDSRLQGDVCSLPIPSGQKGGRYFYHAYVDGARCRVNQPELDIRP